MLTLMVGSTESFNDETQEFTRTGGFKLDFEHSLVSLSKWESKYKKPFISSDKTAEEAFDYIQMMVVTPDFPPEVFQNLNQEDVAAINDYISDKMTATTFHNLREKNSSEIITSEVIYFWMVTMNIPFECQYWHLNRLLTLIKVINVKNAPAQKMNRREALAERKRLNAERRARMGSKG